MMYLSDTLLSREALNLVINTTNKHKDDILWRGKKKGNILYRITLSLS